MSTTSVVLAIVSTVLLAVAALGETTWVLGRLARRPSPLPPLPWGEERVRGASSPRRSERDWKRFAASLPDPEHVGPEAFFVALSEGLSERFPHGVADFTIWSNYVFWAASRVVGRLRAIEDTAHLFRYARCGLCSQIAQAFVDIATRRRQTARVVALRGHVIAEGYYDGKWHMFDPDYGVILRDANGIVSLEQLAASPELARSLYWGARIASGERRAAEFLKPGEARRLSPGAHHSPKTVRCQRILHALKWVVPLVGLLTAAVIGLGGARS